MRTNFLTLVQLALSKKFIVEIKDDIGLGMIFQQDYGTYFQQDYNMFSESSNIVDTIKIGDFKALVMEYPDFPLFLLSLNSVINIEEDLPVSNGNKLDYYLEPSKEYNFGKSYFLQTNPTWNLDRIDQRPNKLNAKYFHPVNGGKNTNVYIIDSGIDIGHPEFESRATWGGNFIDNNNIDCNNHGTHCAGIVGSKTFGVSKKTNLIAVKVLDCQGGGSFSTVLKGMEFVIAQHRSSNKTSVINMSLGGPKSDSIDRALDNLDAAGIHVIVAAGNENSDACNTSPASHTKVVTVGATTKDNKKAYFSNWGKCVTILAPGAEILSTIPGGKTQVMSGTSMASPMTAGVYALILTENPSFTPASMRKLIGSLCTKNTIIGFDPSTVNCFLYSLV